MTCPSETPPLPVRLYSVQPGMPITQALLSARLGGREQVLATSGDAEGVLWEAPPERVIERCYWVAAPGIESHPRSLTRIRALTDASGALVAWWQRSQVGPHRGGASWQLPVYVPHVSVYGVTSKNAPSWRTVRQLCTDHFIDEVARALGEDPMDYRRRWSRGGETGAGRGGREWAGVGVVV
ncbi:hypothetical protein [Caldimonas brevitalea]|uniref:Uncharacterized protein n=1 Tax=Caldimonas brevitalea TaxID=413882 RepID=A0A0G3BJ83_9BURK|nr:hypothetical protein [Caldimonas brevitalea]AKJ28053.1 hypothetical protein AAW51_1362 [Caldimonas brevitalea]